MEIRSRVRSAGEDGAAGPQPEEGKAGAWGVLALVLVAVLLVTAFVYVVPNLPAVFGKVISLLSGLGNFSSAGAGTPPNFSVYSPLIANGSANIYFPSEYKTLASYALSFINKDRSDSGLGPVTLSPNQAGQQHVDSMLRYGYFSHYDTQGFKPYMRYTLLGGVGAVVENVAYISYSGAHYTSVGAVETDLKLLEYSMMNNDSACCNNGHRLNILNPLHNRVSIGIAYNSTTLFFDEDFENYYVDMSVSVSGSDVVTMQGTPVASGYDSQQAIVTYDNTPVAESRAQLNSGPREYDPGTVVGGVLPPCIFACPRFDQGITMYASSWQFTSTKVSVAFSLSDFVSKYGPGVYTIYLITGSSTSSAITSYSLFIR